MSKTNEAPATPFTPFAPLPGNPPLHPPMFDDSKQIKEPAPEPVKRRRGRPAAKPKAAKPAPAEKPARRKAKPRRDRHEVGKAARAPKFDLQTILRVASTLKEADQKLFERLLGELNAMPKGSRVRILAALNGVFG